MHRLIFALLIFCFQNIFSLEHHQALYRSLSPHSFKDQIAFFHLYPETKEGALAKERIEKMMGIDPDFLCTDQAPLDHMILVLSGKGSKTAHLSKEAIEQITQSAKQFANRKLLGFSATTLEQVLLLKEEQIDLFRALSFSMNKEEAEQRQAQLDLMALQIQASLSGKSPNWQENPKKIIDEINHFLFYERGFRFPPQSSFSKDIDRYTFLSSVLDGRKGVCLGVSILYLCLAQRLGLPLEIITPPGHIYVRYRDDQQTINIETTARGIHLPDYVYLGADTRKLQQRTYRETVGLMYINQGSVHWQQDNFEEALVSYAKAKPFLKNDPTLITLEGICLAILGKTEQAKALLSPLKNTPTDYAVSPNTIVDDFLLSRADGNAIKIALEHTDETRQSIDCKRKRLENILQEHPYFQAGWFHLASCWMQLQHPRKALETLTTAFQLGDHSATTTYFLAALSLQRLECAKAWYYLDCFEKETNKRDHHPRCLSDLKRNLTNLYPNL